MLCVFSLLPPFSACLCLPWLPSSDRGQRNCPVSMNLLSPSLPVPVGCDCSEGKGRWMGWGRGREGRKVLVLFLCLTISLTCLSPPLPPPPTDLTPRPGRASQTTRWLSVSCLSDWQDIHSVHGAQLWLQNRADIVVVSKCNEEKLHPFINRLLGGIWIVVK